MMRNLVALVIGVVASWVLGAALLLQVIFSIRAIVEEHGLLMHQNVELTSEISSVVAGNRSLIEQNRRLIEEMYKYTQVCESCAACVACDVIAELVGAYTPEPNPEAGDQ